MTAGKISTSCDMLPQIFYRKLMFILDNEQEGIRYDNSGKEVCYYCGGNIDNKEWDHVYPKFRGGPDHKWNIVLSCQQCNQAKKAQHPIDWLKKLDLPEKIAIDYIARLLVGAIFYSRIAHVGKIRRKTNDQWFVVQLSEILTSGGITSGEPVMDTKIQLGSDFLVKNACPNCSNKRFRARTGSSVPVFYICEHCGYTKTYMAEIIKGL
jgi:predicted RNA-binding Zn-ribbon protein involved in translation (DUF1610 family)